MTADLINLRQARKQQGRAAREKRAEANRIAHGRTKAERTATKAEKELQARQLEAHRRQPEAGGPPRPGRNPDTGSEPAP